MTIPENVFIKSAKYLGDYRIAFRFTDGHSTEIDFHAFLTAHGQNPMATQFLDVTRFKDFSIEQRVDLVWGDWEMCFPFAALYAGDLGVDSLGKKRLTQTRTASRRSATLRGDAVRKKRVSKGATVK
jgi:adenine/guanine phosphoribosyltransferase-like PRPP-binding protein